MSTRSLVLVLLVLVGCGKSQSSESVLVENPKSSAVPVSGSVSVANFPQTQGVSVSNWPTTQEVSGTVSVGNLPATQAISGSVNVANFPPTQTVSGTVIVNPNPYGLLNLQTSASSASGTASAFAFGNTGAHSVQTWLNVSATVPSGQRPYAEIMLSGLPSGTVFYYVPLTYQFSLASCGCDAYVGQTTFPIFIPKNTNYTLGLGRDASAGVITGSFSFSGINLD